MEAGRREAYGYGGSNNTAYNEDEALLRIKSMHLRMNEQQKPKARLVTNTQ